MASLKSGLEEFGHELKNDIKKDEERLVDWAEPGSALEREAQAEAQADADVRYMRLALEEAKKAWRLSPPNPSVGAVIVKDGEVIGLGHTQQTGGPHAEIMALRDAAEKGASVEGATIYVTLEPCSHYGRTPPCAKALIEHRLGRVVAALKDPNPLVAGRGLRMLAEAGIEVECGVCEAEAREVNVSFLTRMTRGTPWVRVKSAVTLDGRTALPDGRSQWITGAQAREDGHFWRGRAGAVLTGIGTVLADNPQLNVRLPDQVRQPMRVVVDARLETPPDAAIIASPGGRTLIAAAAESGSSPASRAEALRQAGAEVVRLPQADAPGRVDLKRLLLELASREVNEVHVEAGPRLSGAFIASGLADELLIYVAPCLFGAGLPPAVIPEPASPGEALRWRIADLARTGGDIRIICRRN